MIKKIVFIFLAVTFVASFSFADVYKKSKLITLDKKEAGGGVGTLYGKYAFTRDMKPMTSPVREIGWLTLKPGDSIGFHKHDSNEDVYIVVSGEGTFKNSDGKTSKVKAGDITIARIGQSHGLTNTGKEDLVIISVIAGIPEAPKKK